MRNNIAIGVDIGGTHITCSGVNLDEGMLLEGSLFRASYLHDDAAPSILRNWASALNQSLLMLDESQLAGIGFAIPGPFDYRNGISRMQHKFPHLYDLHIPTALNPLLMEEKDLPMRFLNDATSFAIGEAWQGVGKGFQRVVVVTLGTGFGSAFLDGCVPVVSGERVPKEGCLWHLPFQAGIADDYFSTRWFIKAYQAATGEAIPDVKTLLEKAALNTTARSLFAQFGQNLAECLAPWLQKFDADILIVGGNIAHSLPLFEADFQAGMKKAGIQIPMAASQLMEKAALLGSARLMDDEFWDKVAAELPRI